MKRCHVCFWNWVDVYPKYSQYRSAISVMRDSNGMSHTCKKSTTKVLKYYSAWQRDDKSTKHLNPELQSDLGRLLWKELLLLFQVLQRWVEFILDEWYDPCNFTIRKPVSPQTRLNKFFLSLQLQPILNSVLLFRFQLNLSLSKDFIFVKKTIASMLVTAVGDEMCWWLLKGTVLAIWVTKFITYVFLH